jgi:antitoxin (DNA-binding transcriptional repressor) of toxin-antitoxin stability system
MFSEGLRTARCLPRRSASHSQILDNLATVATFGPMKEVGIRELKNRLSEYIRLVREGEIVIVTNRGKVVAELRPPDAAGELLQKYPGLIDMVRRGLVRLPLKRNGPKVYPLLPSLTPPGTAAEILDWLREDRR